MKSTLYGIRVTVSIYASTINVYLGNRAMLLVITGVLMLENMLAYVFTMDSTICFFSKVLK